MDHIGSNNSFSRMNCKKSCFFFLILFSLFVLSDFCYASSRPLEVSYPTITLLGEEATMTQGQGLPEYVLYAYRFGLFFGFLTALLSLIVAGALYIMSSAIPSLKAKAKDRAFGAVTGVIFLLLIYLILSTINPELNVLKAPETINVISSTPFVPIESGVKLYKGTGCSDSSAHSSAPYAESVRDLSDARRTIGGLKIIPNSQLNILYFAITHDLVNFKGYCHYFYRNDSACQETDPFVSLSVYRYVESSEGSVIFYREPFYNEEGGWLRVDGGTIIGESALYNRELKNLIFSGNGSDESDCTVPIKEQDCIKWEEDGKTCLDENRKCPSLAGENVSSIKINGNYIVVLFSRDPNDEEAGTRWSNCQVFPTIDDASKVGPKQVKWEYIQSRNNLPDEVVIISVGEK